MSAKFNIIIFTKNVIDLNWLLGVVKVKGLNANINEIESVENWEFEDLQIHACENDTKEILGLLEEGRIISIIGEVNSNKFAVMLSKIENIYEIRVSLDTKHIVYLDSDMLDELTQPIYDEVSNILLSSEMVDSLLISALGVEVIVDYYDDFQKMNLNSYNVVRWVFGTHKTRSNHSLKGYRQVSTNIWDKIGKG
ncbi:hypothetical protein AMQ84_01345 [Paenibacillus riograndensis]|uniref:Uncharacterized protein n=1 Tax=Paenibacillus riograndensis TaxID=483937 RepID=A0A132UC44_9BACL|nr:hypothetical protein [Paenibacillus riograndensis]KWX81031.1 hypothetical protein AMQ84_01345 [Paenibacillus riograndensis]